MTNRYPGTCTDCGHRVASEQGTLVASDDGWTVRHDDCPTEPVAESVGQTCEPGVYVLPDGTIVKVQANTPLVDDDPFFRDIDSIQSDDRLAHLDDLVRAVTA